MKQLILSAILTAAIGCAAAVPQRWTVETSRLAPATFDAVHGETLALEAAFKSYGRPLEMPLNGCCILWQTNGMGSAWWQSPATVVSNRVSASFTPAMDPGATAVTGFLGATGQNYRAAFTIRYRHGPGANPAALPLPTRVLDCATVTWQNPDAAPFALKGAAPGGGITADTATNIVDAIVASSNLVSAAAADARYAPTSTAGTVDALCATQSTVVASLDVLAEILPYDAEKGMFDIDVSHATQSQHATCAGSITNDDTEIKAVYVIPAPGRPAIGPQIDFYDKKNELHSFLLPDGTPVLTANIATNAFPIVTNAYTRAAADARYAPTSTAVTVASHATQLSQLSKAISENSKQAYIYDDTTNATMRTDANGRIYGYHGNPSAWTYWSITGYPYYNPFVESEGVYRWNRYGSVVDYVRYYADSGKVTGYRWSYSQSYDIGYARAGLNPFLGDDLTLTNYVSGSGYIVYQSNTMAPDSAPRDSFVKSSAITGIVTSAIDHTQPHFSNEVLAVGLGIGTNEVAQINAILADSGGTPVGSATTVGGLLAALAAAVAWLKRKKVGKITCTGATDIAADNGEADVSALFTSANTSLVAVCREYGGTQIKQDENGNFYYEVEVED